MESISREFWRRVKINAPDQCWEWIGARTGSGSNYGGLCINGQRYLAHRLAFELANGVSPGRLYVLHRCDNPICVNPSHLFLGTAADNTRDMVSKGRAPTGDKNGLRKHPDRVARGERHGTKTHPERYQRRLTEPGVREMRAAFAAGVSQAAIARKFGLTHQTVNDIVRRKTWKRIG